MNRQELSNTYRQEFEANNPKPQDLLGQWVERRNEFVDKKVNEILARDRKQPADATAEKINQLYQQIQKLIDELWTVVDPTEEELEISVDNLSQDRRDAFEALVDPEATVGKFYLAMDAYDVRVMLAEEEVQ